ncbi:MAG: NADH-ubiquinone oxidoreductase-F iron-sulfur binding region domain-containing protein [Bacteroidales bacterium]
MEKSVSFADLSMCYGRLKERGATLGSGTVIVMGIERKFIPLIQSILRFFRHESRGKCVPCRIGTTCPYCGVGCQMELLVQDGETYA